MKRSNFIAMSPAIAIGVVSLFTDYQNDIVSQVWVKRRMDKELKDFGFFYGVSPATKNLHPSSQDRSGTFPYGVLPHWGKMFTLKSEILHTRYEKMDAFIQLAKQYDPEGKFRNSFLGKNVYRT